MKSMPGRIVEAVITPAEFPLTPPVVMVSVDGGPLEELFAYYPDEISFTPKEFVDLTLDEARALKFRKDKAYLQS